MPLREDLHALRAVQTVDEKIQRARNAIAGLDTGVALADTYRAADIEAKTLRAAATKAQAEQHDAEMRLQSIEAKRAQTEKTLFSGTVTGPRELENLQKEIDMLKRQQSDNEERVLLAMDTASEAAEAAEKAEAVVAGLARKYRAVRAAYKERHAALSTEIAADEQERAKAAKPVPAPLLARYDSIRVKKGAIGAADLLDDGNCGACRTRISGLLSDAVKAAVTVELCEHCGRILIPGAARE